MSAIDIKTKEKRFPVAPDLYGIFFEDISRAGDSGLYPEMLRNRSFEDSIMPDGCTTTDGGKTFVSPTGWIEEFNNGEGMDRWVKQNNIVPTPVPAWYCENAEIALDSADTLNPRRRVSLSANFAPGGKIWNIGYAGVPQQAGKAYNFTMFAKTDKPIALALTIEEKGNVISRCDIEARGNGWVRYDASFVANITTGGAIFAISCANGGEIKIGFTSLMPADTFNGHGLRRDLVEKLRDMHPAFLRFPGGCIVEGFSMETAMYFRNVVGPVWERPSHWLMWHYRTTNGLGFHEYLQLCEDLNLSPLYVCNCGMTCQARQPRFFDDVEQADIIEDTLNALEYALGAPDTKWGALRARMGHEAPFKLEYLEIGNENSGPEYEKRYKLVRRAVLDKYPNMKIIANDRGRGEKLECDIADDHYYNTPEFFAENVGMYDNYDRNEPDIFVGEFAVTQSYEGRLRAAIGEAMYMVGLERNQDVVKLAAFAPLFENLHMYSWYPNLLIFDNYRSFTIPSYYCWRLFGGNRGKQVVVSNEKVGKIYNKFHGLPAITGDYGTRFKNARYDGKPVAPSHDVVGMVEQNGGESVLAHNEKTPFMGRLLFSLSPLVTLGEDVESREGEFEVEVFAEQGKAIGLGMLCSLKPMSYYDRTNPNPVEPWGPRFLETLRWVIADGQSSVVRGMFRSSVVSPAKPVNIKYGEFNTLKYVATLKDVSLYINGELVDVAELPNYPSMSSVVTDTDEQVIIKIVNFSDNADDVEINIDCGVKGEYTVGLLTGAADAENTIENPECVRDVLLAKTGAARNFTYKAPALSVNVLTLTKTE